MTPVAFPKAVSTQANGINDNGWIVGSYVDTLGVTHGFYWDTKKYHKINVKGAASTQAWAINNANLITVFTLDPNGVPLDGYVYDRKTFTNMDIPGATSTVIHGINNNGDINCTIFDASSNRHGVLLHAGTYTQFDDPKGVNTTRADGINDSMAMVGRYSPPDNSNAGFKAKVKP